MNSNTVTAVCRQLIAEAEAIVKYTDDHELVKDTDEETAKLFNDFRKDELEHVQRLCIQLTGLLTPDEGEEEGKE